jgi:hypothetical protein
MEKKARASPYVPSAPRQLAEEFGIGVFQCDPSDDPILDLVDRVGEQRLRESF